jgi:hypothetical protein
MAKIRGLLQLMDEALEMDAAKEAVLRLGMKPDNTALQRANDPRMFPQPGYHGTSYDINKLKDPKLQLFESFYTTTDPSSASEYALSSALRRGFSKGTGSNVMPLMGRKSPSNPFNIYTGDKLSTEAKDYYMREFIKRYQAPEMPLNQSWNEYIKLNKDHREINYLKGKKNSLDNNHLFDFSGSIEAKKEAIKKSGYDGITAGNGPSDGVHVYANPSTDVRSKFAKFNPKKAGIPLLTGGAGGAFMSTNLLAAPSGQPEFREAPMSLLDKAKKYAADSYEYAANEGGPIGKFLYSGGAEALKDIEQGTTPMVKTGRLPAMPTGAALANLLELLQL